MPRRRNSYHRSEVAVVQSAIQNPKSKMLNFLFETFRLGIKNLRLHKLRSLLTALGIIFGVTAVIVMVAIGEGTKQAALEQIRQLGAQNILVRSVKPPESTEASARAQRVLD